MTYTTDTTDTIVGSLIFLIFGIFIYHAKDKRIVYAVLAFAAILFFVTDSFRLFAGIISGTFGYVIAMFVRKRFLAYIIFPIIFIGVGNMFYDSNGAWLDAPHMIASFLIFSMFMAYISSRSLRNYIICEDNKASAKTPAKKIRYDPTDTIMNRLTTCDKNSEKEINYTTWKTGDHNIQRDKAKQLGLSDSDIEAHIAKLREFDLKERIWYSLPDREDDDLNFQLFVKSPYIGNTRTPLISSFVSDTFIGTSQEDYENCYSIEGHITSKGLYRIGRVPVGRNHFTYAGGGRSDGVNNDVHKCTPVMLYFLRNGGKGFTIEWFLSEFSNKRLNPKCSCKLIYAACECIDVNTAHENTIEYWRHYNPIAREVRRLRREQNQSDNEQTQDAAEKNKSHFKPFIP